MLQARIFVAEYDENQQYRGETDRDRQVRTQQYAVNGGQWSHAMLFQNRLADTMENERFAEYALDRKLRAN